MDDKAIAGFRQKLVEDANFRKQFAADPDGTLRSVGINVPSGANIPPIDAEELEGRINRLKTALGSDISSLYTVEDTAKIARDQHKMQRIEEIMNIARSTRATDAELEAVAGGQAARVYTISAYGTMDW